MMKTAFALIFCMLAATSHAGETADLVCSYAPSQSTAVATVSGAAGGAGAATAAVAQATGLSVVAHSSGAYILTGGSGYIAGTLGAAVAGPIIVGVGLVVAGTAVTVELVCAPKNHPEQVAKVEAAAKEFSVRSRGLLEKAKSGTKTQVTAASAWVKEVAGDVFEYATRRK